LPARLLQTYADSDSSRPLKPTAHRPDQARLRRVLDHTSINLDGEIALAQLAEVAGLSAFRFARTFTRAMGVSPSRYISRMRLEKAMAEIAAGKLPLAEIASKAGFSSKASSPRAFYRATGLTPGEYRTHRRSCQTGRKATPCGRAECGYGAQERSRQ
jgi:AraC family transcriptional regulator